eukprot:gene10928-13882_t
MAAKQIQITQPVIAAIGSSSYEYVNAMGPAADNIAIPEFVVGEGAGGFAEAAETLGEVAADEDAGEGRHGAFEEEARWVGSGGSQTRRVRDNPPYLRRGCSRDGAGADGGEVGAEVGEDAREIPWVERV